MLTRRNGQQLTVGVESAAIAPLRRWTDLPPLDNLAAGQLMERDRAVALPNCRQSAIRTEIRETEDARFEDHACAAPLPDPLAPALVIKGNQEPAVRAELHAP